MPSGNATFTYRGDEPSITVQGQEFVAGEATLVTDNGIIAALTGREDFAEPAAQPAPKKASARK